ncbi:MAG: RNA ligase family protein [Candidatus Pacearchaeota archaeon]
MNDKKYPDFVKYMRIPHLNEIPFLLDRPVEVYEKLDGGNVQVRMYNGRILAGNRANYLTSKFISSKSHTPECRWFEGFLKWASKNYSFCNLPEDKIIFGEWLAKHTLDYFPDCHNKFYLVDIFDIPSQRFIPYNDAKAMSNNLDIENIRFLNPVHRGIVNLQKLERLVDKSDYCSGKMEGVVIKDYNSQRFAKLWESSINRKKRIVGDEDIRRTIMTMVESELEITNENIVVELMTDLLRQNIPYTRKIIETAVNNYFLDSRNIF